MSDEKYTRVSMADWLLFVILLAPAVCFLYADFRVDVTYLTYTTEVNRMWVYGLGYFMSVLAFVRAAWFLFLINKNASDEE